ncbi:MAG: hypothetical protein ABI680_05865, partial [Chthoniobacteraceae bacterium]
MRRAVAPDYKDGKVNRVLLKKETGQESAWGWSTGNSAIAVEGTNIFIANKGKRLLRFSWTPGDLDSAKFVEKFEMPEPAVGLSARDGKLAVAYPDRVELRKAADFSVIANFPVADLKEVVIAPDGSVWMIAGTGLKYFTAEGKGIESSVEGVGKPTALAFDNEGRLMVCDDGPDQQIKFFDVSGASAKLVSAFGEKG